MVWFYIGAAAVLAAGAAAPTVLARRRRRETITGPRAAATAAIAELEGALDAFGTGRAARAAAERYLLMAGAALGGKDTPAKCRRAEAWARQGLAELRRNR